ncbi:MAG TPA: tripartite tricarboxylate transporter substrate binding protein [Ramlibacter sp.]|nr:tripartite tricarboxylate transporter substrate binding protein [Ramlibacter sp.]
MPPVPHLRRRHLLVLGAAAPAAAFAQGAGSFPNKPIRLVVPFAAGGGTDVLARLLAKALSSSLGQQVVVENVTGAGGVVGAQQVARATPDGYTLMIGTPGSILINPAMQPDLRYNADKDFVPVAQFSDSPIILVVNRDTPFRTVADLVAAARDKPGALNFGSAGVGSISHFSTEMFQMLAKVKMTHVPYRGTAPALTDLRAGTLQVQFENLPAIIGLIQEQQVRPLAIGSGRRSSLLPDVPTLIEAGVPGYESSSWTGLFAPAGTPADVLTRLERAVAEAVRDPATQKSLKDLGAEPVGNRSAEFRAFLGQRRPLVEQTVKAAGMTAK